MMSRQILRRARVVWGWAELIWFISVRNIHNAYSYFGLFLTGGFAQARRLLRSPVNDHQGSASPPSIKRTTEIKTSRTQGSCLSPVFAQSLTYSSYGSFPMSFLGWSMPMSSRVRANLLPIFGSSTRRDTLSLSGFFICFFAHRWLPGRDWPPAAAPAK